MIVGIIYVGFILLHLIVVLQYLSSFIGVKSNVLSV